MTTTETTTVQDQVTALNAGWYNQLSSVMNLPATFQLAQGTLGVQTADSSGLFRMADAVPPSASVAYFDPGSMQLRSQNFGELLQALLPEGGVTLRTALGDRYAAWIQYSAAYWAQNPQSTLTQLQLFMQWANQALDPDQLPTAIAAYQQSANSPYNTAFAAFYSPNGQTSFVDSSGKSFTLPTYSGTLANATQALQQGQTVTIDFDSQTMNTTLAHTTVQGSATGFYDIFSGSASGSFDQLNATAAASQWKIQGNITYATLVTAAGSWFTSAELERAYNADGDDTVWNPASSAGNWNSFFGPTGALAQHVSQLVLVTDYTLTVTSYADYSTTDIQTIKANASFGIWPFFSASASATHHTDVEQGDSGSMVVTHTLAKGLIEIWGATVESAPN